MSPIEWFHSCPANTQYTVAGSTWEAVGAHFVSHDGSRLGGAEGGGHPSARCKTLKVPSQSHGSGPCVTRSGQSTNGRGVRVALRARRRGASGSAHSVPRPCPHPPLSTGPRRTRTRRFTPLWPLASADGLVPARPPPMAPLRLPPSCPSMYYMPAGPGALPCLSPGDALPRAPRAWRCTAAVVWAVIGLSCPSSPGAGAPASAYLRRSPTRSEGLSLPI